MSDTKWTGTAAGDLIRGIGPETEFHGLGGDDSLYGAVSGFTPALFEGGAGNDNLVGGKGADTFVGGAGDDTITGDTAGRFLGGYATGDTAVFSGARAGYAITFDADTLTFTVRDLASGRDGTDTVQFVGNFQFADGVVAAADLASGYDAALASMRDRVLPPPPPPPVPGADITGTEGADDLQGTYAGSDIFGLGGDDALYASVGSDVHNLLDGGAGNDSLIGSKGADTLVGGAGDDVLTGTTSYSFLQGFGSADTAVFSGARADYEITLDPESLTFTIRDRVAHRDGTDTVQFVQHFRFADGTVNAQDLASGYAEAFANLHDRTMVPAPQPPVEGFPDTGGYIDWAVTDIVLVAALTGGVTSEQGGAPVIAYATSLDAAAVTAHAAAPSGWTPQFDGDGDGVIDMVIGLHPSTTQWDDY